jgi:hypothetical protein
MTNKRIKEYRRIISKETCKEKYGISEMIANIVTVLMKQKNFLKI